jgi:hypothetical protein
MLQPTQCSMSLPYSRLSEPYWAKPRGDTRRISCIEQPMRPDSPLCRPQRCCLGRRLVRVVADGCQRGERQHHQRDVTMSAMPGSGFVVAEAKPVLDGLETVLDGPALPFNRGQGLDAGANWALGGEVSAGAISHAAPDQQASRPKPALSAVVYAGIKIGQFQIAPVVEPRHQLPISPAS